MHTRLLAASVAALLTGALAAPAVADGNGWVQLTPWTYDSPFVGFEHFGEAVELADGWAFVSARGTESVEVYRRDGAALVPHQVLTSPDGPEAYDDFGQALEVEGGTLFVGAPHADGEQTNQGRAFVFELQGGQWTHADTLEDPSPTYLGEFGSAIDADGDWLAISAPIGGTGSNERVLVFTESFGAWEFDQWVGALEQSQFGSSVAIHDRGDGDADLFVGAPGADAPEYYGGNVQHYLLTPNGPWFGPTLAPDELVDWDVFGGSLATDGVQLFVGASGRGDGEVFVFDVDSEPFLPTLQQVDVLAPDLGGLNARFGDDLDLDGQRLVVGASRAAKNEVQQPGAVFVYRPEVFGSGWQLEDRLDPADAEQVSWLGTVVAVDGNLVLAGAPLSDDGEQGPMDGVALLFSLTSKEIDGGLAPMDVLATAVSYGPTTGPVLSATVLPVPGESALLGVKPVTPAHVPFVAYGFAPTELPIFGATLLVADPEVIVRPPAGQFGQIGVAWPVPNDPLLYGAEVFTQVWLLDPFALPALQLEATNGLRLTIGF